jgi:hypothetical protein
VKAKHTKDIEKLQTILSVLDKNKTQHWRTNGKKARKLWKLLATQTGVSKSLDCIATVTTAYFISVAVPNTENIDSQTLNRLV